MGKRRYRDWGGSDRKLSVEYEGAVYMLKFAENHAKKTDMSTSYVNSVISEYISSHIAATTDLPVHETVLGYYNDDIVVACKDFRQTNERNIEFQEFVHAVYDSKDIKRVIKLSQIYETLNDKTAFDDNLKQSSIDRYWETFVVDALVGNFDRHIGNWGYIANDNTNTIRLAPLYDFGSTLLPQLSDDGMIDIVNNEFEMLRRCLVFPSPALYVKDEKVGKVGYYDMMSSNYDENCTKAVKRIVPQIKLNDVYNIIDNTPLISDTRKTFYKKIITLRKETVLDRAYDCCTTQKYDTDALERLQKGKQYSEDLLNREIALGSVKSNIMLQSFEQSVAEITEIDQNKSETNIIKKLTIQKEYERQGRDRSQNK